MLWFIKACVSASLCESYLVLLLLLLTEVTAVGVIFDNLLAHVIHSVHQKLKALLQVVAGREMSACHVCLCTAISSDFVYMHLRNHTA